MAASDGRIVVGSPFERVGTVAGAGMVHAFSYDPATKAVTRIRGVTQNTAGIPGTSQPWDLFGYSVAYGRGALDGAQALVIGAPGDTVSGLWAAGSALLVADDSSGRARALSQGTGGLGGRPEADDSAGERVSVVPTMVNGRRLDKVAIAVAQEFNSNGNLTGVVTVVSVRGGAVTATNLASTVAESAYGKGLVVPAA